MSEFPVSQIQFRPGVIDLGMGNPDFDLLPVEILQKSAQEYFAASDPQPLQYGNEAGDGYFRRSLAEFLSRRYAADVDPELLFVTAGASSALDLLCTLFTRPGDEIFVEEPTYFLALRIFEDHGLNVVPVPMDAEGLKIDAVEEKLEDHAPKFIYTIPIFQNPSGITLSPGRREKLVNLARQYNFLVVADEAYQFLSYAPANLPSFADYTANYKQVVSVNSFSKILAPGLRLGWIQAHPDVIERLTTCGLLESGGGMNPYTSALVRGLLNSGALDQNISILHEAYSERLQAMDTALKQHLPGAEYSKPDGGFFFWVRLPGVNAAVFRKKLVEFKVDFRQGALFSSRAGMDEHLRLGFCFYNADDIEEGIKRLRDCLAQ